MMHLDLEGKPLVDHDFATQRERSLLPSEKENGVLLAISLRFADMSN
jgi:hypothetical protein